MKITFMGAAKTVTGSKYLIQADGKNILVDCGLFQGHKKLRERNWNTLPIDPHSIDAVILTHAHIDHTGYLPLLVKRGFSKKIYCSQSTYDLCRILLPDSAHLQEEEAKFVNLYGFSKHKPALPLYTVEDAERALEHFHPIPFGIEQSLQGEVSVTLQRAGHILGASFVLLKQNKTTLCFSGDIGRPHDPIMEPPSTVQMADYLILESTYGDRSHGTKDTLEQLADVINRTVKRGGTIIIPAFAVGRAQSILYFLSQLKLKNRIPDIPIYLDSPMAIDATELFCAHSSEHRLSKEQSKQVCSVATYTNTPEQSKELTADTSPKIIISASGMATGGRILFHLKQFAPDARNTILFTGFQAPGTRGSALVNGRDLKIHGEIIPVKAEITELDNLSAHADADEILTWLEGFQKPPRKVFITHGEVDAAEAMKAKIEEKFGWTCIIPEYMQTEEL